MYTIIHTKYNLGTKQYHGLRHYTEIIVSTCTYRILLSPHPSPPTHKFYPSATFLPLSKKNKKRCYTCMSAESFNFYAAYTLLHCPFNIELNYMSTKNWCRSVK